MPVSVVQVEAFLADYSGGLARDVAPLGRGEWSQAFAYASAGRDYVIRFGAHRDDFEKDRLAARYAGPALPIPAVLDLGEAFGGHYCVAERAWGDYIDEVDATQLRGLLPALWAALDAMREVDLSATRGWGGWNGAGVAPHASWAEALLSVADDRPERMPAWRARLAASAVGLGPFEEAFRRLAELVEGLPVERHLIHMDLLHFNVLVQGGRITSVLDWGCGMYGDCLYDLAWWCFWQPWYPQWREIDFRAEALRHYAAIGLDVPQFEERLACCQLHIGLDGMLYQAWAGDLENLPLTAARTLAIASS